MITSFIPTKSQPTATLFPYTTLFRSHKCEFGVLVPGPNMAPGPASDGGGIMSKQNCKPLTLMFSAVLVSLGSAIVSAQPDQSRSEEHTSELQSHHDLVCRLLLEKNNI